MFASNTDRLGSLVCDVCHNHCDGVRILTCCYRRLCRTHAIAMVLGVGNQEESLNCPWCDQPMMSYHVRTTIEGALLSNHRCYIDALILSVPVECIDIFYKRVEYFAYRGDVFDPDDHSVEAADDESTETQ